jgi:hypothetical protein
MSQPIIKRWGKAEWHLVAIAAMVGHCSITWSFTFATNVESTWIFYRTLAANRLSTALMCGYVPCGLETEWEL